MGRHTKKHLRPGDSVFFEKDGVKLRCNIITASNLYSRIKVCPEIAEEFFGGLEIVEVKTDHLSKIYRPGVLFCPKCKTEVSDEIYQDYGRCLKCHKKRMQTKSETKYREYIVAKAEFDAIQ